MNFFLSCVPDCFRCGQVACRLLLWRTVQEQKYVPFGVVFAFATMSNPQALTVAAISKKVIS